MTAPAITIHPDAPLAAAARRMNEHRVRLLPVVTPEGDLLGVVSRRNLLSIFLRPDEDIADEVRTVLRDLLLIDEGKVTVSARDGTVTLDGQVADKSSHQAAIRVASDVDGVAHVYTRPGCAQRPLGDRPREREGLQQGQLAGDKDRDSVAQPVPGHAPPAAAAPSAHPPPRPARRRDPPCCDRPARVVRSHGRAVRAALPDPPAPAGRQRAPARPRLGWTGQQLLDLVMTDHGLPPVAGSAIAGFSSSRRSLGSRANASSTAPADTCCRTVAVTTAEAFGTSDS